MSFMYTHQQCWRNLSVGDGVTCELSTGCSSRPCFNGGSCYSGSDNMLYICNCTDGFVGMYAESVLSLNYVAVTFTRIFRKSLQFPKEQ